MVRSKKELAGARIALLEEWQAKLREWWEAEVRDRHDEVPFAAATPPPPTSGKEALKTFVNKKMFAVRQALGDLGMNAKFTVGPVHGITGERIALRTVDGLSASLFVKHYGVWLVPSMLNAVEAAIGALEMEVDGSGLVQSRGGELADVLDSMTRGLRAFFKREPPADEIQVQDALAAVLATLDISASRETEVIPVGAKGSKPDFVLTALETPLEVKYVRGSRTLKEIQEEMNADITAFKTRWERIVFIVYDAGMISDPRGFECENERLFEGVIVRVVKH